MMFTDLALRGGATRVIVTDLHDYRLQVARTVGATRTVNAGREDVAAAVADETHGAMADVAIEACGRPEAAHQVFQVLRQQGLACIFGMAHTQDAFEFNWTAMYDKLPRMVVTNSARSGDRVKSVETAVDLVAQGRLDFSYLVTHRLPFKDLQQAYDLYSAKIHSAMKVVIEV
jgi:threonine dehydrogenase-like Zn-dependent dehydrogenase